MLKIVGITLLVIIGILVAIPIFLESKIGTLVRNNVNSSINADFDFDDADLSLISSFPNAELSLKGMRIINTTEPFKGDTLFYASEASMTMGLGELFKGAGEAYSVRKMSVDGARLYIVLDENENANYDITKESDEPAADFTFELQGYSIDNATVTYLDRSSGIRMRLDEIAHTGSGDLSLVESKLQTNTNALLSFEMDSVNYLDRSKLQLEALIGIDLEKDKYTFLENQAMVNQLPLVFEGYVQLFEEYNQVDLKFKTPSSDFKNFLGVMPEEYAKNLDQVTTSGDFMVEGTIAGKVDDTFIPRFDIQINSDNASFKYPDLPMGVSDIVIDAAVKNTTGISEDTFVDIKKASFRIGQDYFTMTSNITELLGNTRVTADIDANMNLANISKAYPLPAAKDLKGLLRADVSTAFDMASIEKKQYQNTKTSGTASLRNFEYSSAELKNPVAISSMEMNFTPTVVSLKKMEGKTGNTDFAVQGSLRNLLGFMFNDQPIRGQFTLNSDTFDLGDFMTAETTTSGGEGEKPKVAALKIPSFLDVSLQARANTVIYDNLNLKNMSGELAIRDQKATLSGLTSSLLGGRLNLSGNVSTKEARPVFDMQLGIADFSIAETFKQVELLRALAPVANALQGRLNSTLNLNGLLTEEMTPDLATLTGNALAELLQTSIDPEKEKLLALLDSKLNFLNLDSLNLRDLKTALSFENGLVRVKPFTVKYKDIAIDVAGQHTFNKELEYNATIQVPAKYLGKEVNNLIARIDDQQLKNLTIPVVATMKGTYANPQVSTDLAGGVKQLTARLVEIEKQKLIGKGTDKAKDLIGGLITGKKDSTATKKDSTARAVKGVLGNVLGKKPQDSIKRDSPAVKKDPVKDAARDILGGILNKKKKDTTKTKKDSVQP